MISIVWERRKVWERLCYPGFRPFPDFLSRMIVPAKLPSNLCLKRTIKGAFKAVESFFIKPSHVGEHTALNANLCVLCSTTRLTRLFRAQCALKAFVQFFFLRFGGDDSLEVFVCFYTRVNPNRAHASVCFLCACLCLCALALCLCLTLVP